MNRLVQQFDLVQLVGFVVGQLVEDSSQALVERAIEARVGVSQQREKRSTLFDQVLLHDACLLRQEEIRPVNELLIHIFCTIIHLLGNCNKPDKDWRSAD